LEEKVTLEARGGAVGGGGNMGDEERREKENKLQKSRGRG